VAILVSVNSDINPPSEPNSVKKCSHSIWICNFLITQANTGLLAACALRNEEAGQGRWSWPASLFRNAQAATLLEFHVPLTNCFVRRWFCAVHGPKPPLHHHNWLSFGKFQDTERFLIHCARHFSSRLSPSSGTYKYAKAPSTKKTLRDSLPIDILLSAVSVLVVAQSSSEVPEGIMNNPLYLYI